MEFIDIYNKISFGDVVATLLAILFVGGLVMKGLKKYHNFKKTIEEKDKLIDGHTDKIDELDKTVNQIDGKMDTILAALDNIKCEADQREARRLRREILKFSDNIRNGKTFSRDAYQDIIESNEEYERIIARQDIKNGFTEHEVAFIEKKYDELYGG